MSGVWAGGWGVGEEVGGGGRLSFLEAEGRVGLGLGEGEERVGLGGGSSRASRRTRREMVSEVIMADPFR